MKIVNKSATETIMLNEFKEGDVFKFNENYYMKTATECIKRASSYGVDIITINAINLSTGKFTNFSSNLKVIPVDCELVIK